MDLRQIVREGMMLQGWSWAELARRAGVDAGHLRAWRRGDRGMSVARLERVLDALRGER